MMFVSKNGKEERFPYTLAATLGSGKWELILENARLPGRFYGHFM